MIHIHIESHNQLTSAEIEILATLLNQMCEHPNEFLEGKRTLFHDELTLTHVRVIDNVETARTLDMPYETFVRLITRGINAQLILTAQTKDGEVTIAQPLLPVLLVDMPAIKQAAITLEYLPEFLPYRNDKGEIVFAFRGQMRQLVESDIDNIPDDADAT